MNVHERYLVRQTAFHPQPNQQMTTDTPRTDACPHCGAAGLTGMIAKAAWKCGNATTFEGRRSELCREREARKNAEAELAELWSRFDKQMEAEAEVDRLRSALQSCFWATNTYDGNYTRACDNVAIIAVNALKTQDK